MTDDGRLNMLNFVFHLSLSDCHGAVCVFDTDPDPDPDMVSMPHRFQPEAICPLSSIFYLLSSDLRSRRTIFSVITVSSGSFKAVSAR